MSKRNNCKTAHRTFNPRLAILFILVISLCLSFNGRAHAHRIELTRDTAIEKKVDYLEHIYFSGGTKEELNIAIIVTLQEIGTKLPTLALAKQVTFLSEIKDKALAADNACDILDLLSVGIYNIDPADAQRQGVKFPSDKAKAKAGDAISSLYKLNSTANNLGSGASNLAWSSYLLSGGKYTGFGAGAGKVANTATIVGSTAGAIGQAAQTGKQLGELGKSLGIGRKKDKACNDVAKKDIEIGEHSLPATIAAQTKEVVNPKPEPPKTDTANMSKVMVWGADYEKLSSIQERLKSIGIVTAVKMNFDVNGSSLNVTHTGSCQDLLAQMLGACKGILTSKNVMAMNPEEKRINIKL